MPAGYFTVLIVLFYTGSIIYSALNDHSIKANTNVHSSRGPYFTVYIIIKSVWANIDTQSQ